MPYEFFDRIRVTIEDGIAQVAMTRAARHNGMDFPMIKAMLAAQKLLRARRDVRCAVLHGEGPSFCAGLDLKSVMSNPRQAFVLYLKLWWPFANAFQRFSLGWRKLPFPVIAAVHGNCFGAGIQLALGADIRIARSDAQLSIMESKWGLIPDMGGMVLLRELLPIDRAKELTMTGRVFSGAEAHALGLVTHLADDPVLAARALAAEIAIRSPDAIAAGKFLMQRSWVGSEHRALALERRYQRRIINKRNQKIAVARNQRKADMPFAARRIDR
ncbi:crotonase/enoyl-CoA hydratase family protein [Solimonas terrae]|uniref:Crotonase/enoyl-CoA hydratase family protein n=1 Tax=Solimonas terrae TaxID=1396819 RepID=A0A6M2BTM1_9GAMM|nr:crotonase/enoyl-CoA hydratase family protein [Solimonas terrae]NGY05463.1 crotonase/enoyl-CoA hydratase family protein [Solimonas terrae]